MTIEHLTWGLWGLWVLLAFACTVNLRRFIWKMSAQNAAFKADGPTPASQKPAAVIIATKSTTSHTEAFLQAMLNQDYASYRLIFAVESESDPAAARIRESLGLTPGQSRWYPPETDSNADTAGSFGKSPGLTAVDLVVAGHSADTGQKVHNQIAAFRELSSTDALIVFADSDLHAHRDWLAQLAAPLNRVDCPTCTGYRWLVPERPTLPNLFGSVMNASVATLGGIGRYQTLWGGSMALTREVFDELDVPALFKGSLNDDVHLGRAVRLAGHARGWVYSLQMPTPVHYSWHALAEFARRQYYQIYHYVPRFFIITLPGTGLPVLGWLTSLAAVCTGYPLAWIPIAAVTTCDQVRAFSRWQAARRLFEPNDLDRLRPVRLLEHFATPLWLALHFSLAFSALFMKTITWAGITYKVHTPRKISILHRAK